MISPRAVQRLIELVIEVQLAEPSPAALSELESLLESPDARRLYIELINVQNHLETLHTQREAEEAGQRLDAAEILAVLGQAEDAAPDYYVASQDYRAQDPSLAGSDGSHHLTLQQTTSALMYLLRQQITPRRVVMSGVAAVLLLGLTIALALQGGNTQPPTGPTNLAQTPQDVKPPPRTVATLTAEHDAQWQAASGTHDLPDVGDTLLAGQRLTLTQGFAQITTQQGAVAILEAPCTVEMLSRDNALYLHAGKLVGVVETEQAKGFQVRTPHMDVRDLGTRFGVVCRSDATYLRVVEGEVHATSVDLISDEDPMVVTAGQSAIVRWDLPGVKLTDDAAERFVTSLQAVADMPTIRGDIHYEPSMPIDLRVGAYENDKILFFPERSGVAIQDVITVNLIRPGHYHDDALQQPVGLELASAVDSYFVHFDTAEVNSSGLKSATIAFDRPIVGVITSSQALAQSHETLGLPDVLYGSMTAGRDAAFTGLDGSKTLPESVVISDDRRTLTLQMTTGKGIDQVRILVAHD